MKKILMALALFVTSVSFAGGPLSNASLSALAKANKPLYVRINKNISTPAQYDSVQIERSKGGWLASDKYTMRLTFKFKRAGAYGSKNSNVLFPIKQGALMSVSNIEVNPSHYQSSDSYYLSAEGPSVNLGDGQSTRESIYLQILGNNANNISKLTVGELESLFDNVITIYSN